MGDNLELELDNVIFPDEEDNSDKEKVNAEILEAVKKHHKDRMMERIEEFKNENEELDKLRNDRRKFSERLETDVEFREQYIAAEKERLRNKNIKELMEDTFKPDGGGLENYHKSTEALPEPDKPSKYTIYINNVETFNLTIKI